MVTQHSSSKNKKTVLLLAGDAFSIGYTFEAYTSLDGYWVTGDCASLDSGIPVSLGSNSIRDPIIAINGAGVKLACSFYAIAVDEWLTNNAMLNAWR